MIRLFPLLVFLAIFHFVSAAAQSPTNVYPPEGVYASFSSFRNGKPDVTKSQIVKPASAHEYSIRQWVNSEKLEYSDSIQQIQKYSPEHFWGFVEKGTLYIFLGNKFHKVNTLGQISYFLESYPIIKGNMAPVVTDARATSSYRLLDMETGDIVDYTVDNLEELLEKDETLHLEYKSIISQKEKRRKMFIYLEKFNNKHPLERQVL